MIDINPQFMNELKQELIERVGKLPLNEQFELRLAKPDTWIINCINLIFNKR